MEEYRLSQYIEKIFETPSKDFPEWLSGLLLVDKLSDRHILN